MTTLLLKDEHYKRLAVIAADVVTHALCNTMLTELGHESAEQLLEGKVTPLMLRRRLAAWSPQRRRHIASVLVGLGIWTERADGVFQFADWDLEQPSAKSTVQQREKWKAHKRAQRAARGGVFSLENGPKPLEFPPPPKNEIPNDFAPHPADVHPPVHPPSDPIKRETQTLPPLIQIAHPTGEPRAERAAPPPKAKLTGPKKARPVDPLKTAVVESYEKAYHDRYRSPPTPPNWPTVQKVVQWAKLMPDPEAAIRQSLAGYFSSWIGTKCRHGMIYWAKDPAAFHAEGKDKGFEEGPVVVNGVTFASAEAFEAQFTFEAQFGRKGAVA